MSSFKAWAKDASVRGIKTAYQVTVSALGTNSIGATHLSLRSIGGIAAGSLIASVLQNLSRLKVANPELAAALKALASVKSVTAPAVTFTPTTTAPPVDWSRLSVVGSLSTTPPSETLTNAPTTDSTAPPAPVA